MWIFFLHLSMAMSIPSTRKGYENISDKVDTKGFELNSISKKIITALPQYNIFYVLSY